MARLAHPWCRGVITAWLLFPLMAQAELTVIYDNGNTMPIAPFLEAFGPVDETPQKPQIPATLTPGASDPKTWLPIKSPGLTPGPVRTRSHNQPFSRPFFLIGSDDRSRKWLVEYRQRLKEIGAVGMLVQAETIDDLQGIARLTDGLPITPASASDIAAALGIAHYPVLITPQGIEQ